MTANKAMPRLPPMNGLRAFEATARRLSFSRAAEELCVTQSAISRQIAKLENHLGASLFSRKYRRIRLTPKGMRFYASVRDAFQRIEDGVELLKPDSANSVLKIKVPPTLGVRWLIPRLVQFHGRHREIDVQITTSHHPVDFDLEDVDVAVHWGLGHWDGLLAHFLIGEELTPACSPALLRKAPLRVPNDLVHHVLLHSMHRTNDWQRWLEAAGAPKVDWTRALRFENSGLTYQAAINGLGVVVAQRAFIADDIAAGKLVEPFPLVVPGEHAYFLVYPPERKSQSRVVLFRDWLLETVSPNADCGSAGFFKQTYGGDGQSA